MYDDIKSVNEPNDDLLSAVQRVLAGKAQEGDVEKIASPVLPVSEKSKPKESKVDTEYEKFFLKVLKKFGVNEPDELPDDKKKEFYNYIDKNWKAKGEGKQGARMTKRGLVDGRTKAYKETVKRLLAKKNK
tara:strand:+ start:28628 stop:29020 length:393 start_codon:yes stop_codon:yes gene_type:complete